MKKSEIEASKEVTRGAHLEPRPTRDKKAFHRKSDNPCILLTVSWTIILGTSKGVSERMGKNEVQGMSSDTGQK